MKHYLLDRGLIPGSNFTKSIEIEKLHSMDTILLKVRAYIAYKEKTVATITGPRSQDTNKNSRHENFPHQGGEKRNEDRSRETKDHRRPVGRFIKNTPLNSPRECILAKCQSTNFKNSNARAPKPNPTRPGTDKSKW